MDAERARTFLLTLPFVEETLQWGGSLVFWVGDKAIGGKMFAIVSLEGVGRTVLSFSADPEAFAELIEIEGVIPAPYLARAHWVALTRWDALRPAELHSRLRAARDLIAARLPRRTQTVLAMPAGERRKLIAARRRDLAARAATKAATR